MQKTLNRKLLVIVIVLLSMVAGTAVQGMFLQNSVDFGEPGFSLRYDQSFGVTREAYVFTNDHINHPRGLFVDSDNALYVVEHNGYRVMKFDSTGDYEMSFGEVGQPWHHDHFLYNPNDVVVGDAGHVWVVMEHGIKEFDADGNFVQSFPAADLWESGDGNDRFNNPYQAVFNNDGSKLFVSDTNNQRIQIFTLNPGDNSLVYSETIDADNSTIEGGGFESPKGLAMDSVGRLYVMDQSLHRVLRCEFDLVDTEWVCENFFGETGVEGDDLFHLRWALAVYIDESDLIFIADGNNGRVLKCTDTGDCGVFVDASAGGSDYQLTFLHGIAGDSFGNIYVSDKDNHRVQVYGSSGVHLKTYGIFGEPYQVDKLRLNQPHGVAIGPDGSILVNEHSGHRLIKMDAEGNQLWAVGQAGVYGDDDGHFGQFWTGMEGSPAVDSNHRIYVSDSPNNRIKIYDRDGELLDTFGSWGQGNTEFVGPATIAISPVNGDIYIADSGNHRIQVFNKDLVYIATIGVTNQSGDDDQHFNNPMGLAVDDGGAIYVGDTENFRVQKCSLNGTNYSCQTLIGEVGVYQRAFGHVFPYGVAVDAEGRIFVTDRWENRVQVFDATGAFLTSVGNWGSNTSQFMSAYGIALDAEGDVFVADPINHRIQKFTIGVPDWTQVNINGFGVSTITFVSSLIEFNGLLYAGTSDWDKGGQIWRSSDGITWSAVNEPGFGDVNNSAIISLFAFDGQLYASTGWGGGAGQIWRSSNGENWTAVVSDGFGNPNNYSIERFIIFDDVLYASTGNDVDGSEVWMSDSGDTGTWTSVILGGNGNSNVNHVNSFVLFDGYLYAAGENWVDGAQVWRTSNGADWNVVSTNGFGNANNIHIGSMIEFKGMLYASTRNDETGAEIFRSANGTTWSKVIGSGINDPRNIKFESLFEFNDQMFVTANNYETGLKVWCSNDGMTFTQLIDDGFGDSNNGSTLWNNAMIDFKNQLYIGTNNLASGGELWRYEKSNFKIYLPLIVDNYQAPVEKSWKTVTSPTTQTLNAIKLLSADKGWAVGDAGTILSWNGSAWSGFSSPTTNNLNGFALLDWNNAWAVGDSGTILNWNGSTWQSYTSPSSHKLNDIHFLNANNGWIVGESGTLLYWNGSSWQTWTSPTTYDLYALDFLTDTDGWAVGGASGYGTGKSEILKWNGIEWTVYVHEHSLPAIDILYDIDMVSSTFGIALGMNNNGEKWNGYYWTWDNPNPPLIWHYGVHFLSESDGWSVGWIYEESNILHWKENIWENVPCPVDSALMDVYMLDSDHGWIVGAEGVILRYGK